MERVGPFPTIDDLRVKQCFICHEEEYHDQPIEPSRTWVHPCTCTLVAHESCLLRWVYTSEEGRRSDFLKCSQCGTRYEMTSTRPTPLRVLEYVKNGLDKIGLHTTYVVFGSVAAAAASGVYVLLTAYGAFAVRQFLGQDMFSAIIGDDPADWPWNAYLFLPYVPCSLLIRRFLSRRTLGIPIIPLVAVWATMRPGNVEGQPLNRLLQPDVFAAYNEIRWPPSPFQLAVASPIIRSAYQAAFNRLSHYILKTKPRVRQVRRLGLNALGLQLGIEIREEVVEAHAQVLHDEENENGGRNEDHEDVNRQEIQREDDENEEAQIEAAEHLAENASVALVIGEVLMLPVIASTMGKVLLKLSEHSTLLRRFLAVRPPMSYGHGLPKGGPSSFNGTTMDWPRAKLLAKLMMQMWWRGTPLWLEADPVWWRNLLGWGLYSLTLDCTKLWFAWLKKRELATRRLKNRPFSGVDVSQLDLIDPSRWVENR